MNKLLVIVIIFLLGLYYECSRSGHSTKEAFTGSHYRCPNILIQKGQYLYLFNSKIAEVPGVNPIVFNNLEEYVEFIDWQRSQGIRCPVLFLQEIYDTQGKPVYKMRPSPTDQQGGLPPTIPMGKQMPQQSKLIDAGRSDPPYNVNSYPAFDHDNQYIGLETPLDKMYHEDNINKSPNPMDPNWGGPEYTQELVDKGYYAEDEVMINVP